MKSNFNIPSEFTDEDKWFKFFTKKALVVLMVSGMLGYAIASFFWLFGAFVPGIITASVLVVLVTGSTMICLPDTEYMKGGGQTIDTIFVRKLMRKMEKRTYLIGYHDD